MANMVLIQRANKQLRIPKERLEEYERQGYELVVPDDSPKFICPVCGREYKSEAALNKHIAKEHPEDNDPEDDETPEDDA